MPPSHPVVDPPDRRPDRTEVTGPQAWAVYDVWEPPAARRPRGVGVVVLPAEAGQGDGRLAPLAAALADDGFHVAVVGYAGDGPPGDGEPGTSAAEQLAAVRADAAFPARMILLGHAAAGHLVWWLLAQDPPAAAAGLVLAPSADPAGLLPGAPVTVVTAAGDEVVPAATSAAYGSGGPPEQRVSRTAVAGAGHLDLIDPTHPAYLTVLAHLEDLLLRLDT